ncbi:MAG: CheR family methyltransferase [Candidatus Hodarchaeales archaeon]|jgi:chemotaxis protein methyltransferase CheR
MQIKYDKFSIKLESDEGLEELMDFLQLKRVELSSNARKRIISRLRHAARKLDLRSFSELSNRLKSDQKAYNNVLHWLEKGKSYNEEDQSFSPLINRKASLREYVNISKTKPQKHQKKKKKKDQPLAVLPGIKMPVDKKNLSLIYDFLTRKNINYQAYKPNHFLRRLNARMKRVDAETYKEYHNFLETVPTEFDLLMANFSINVTRFFRDRDLFIVLEKKVFPTILNNNPKNIRIWSAGCAIGPEPYSIAILLKDIHGVKSMNKVFLLATDINQRLLLQAKKGIYTKQSLEELDSPRRLKYFTPLDSELFQISAQIRNTVTFQQHDLRTPPPARDFDLIMCRNVLIYFSRSQSNIFLEQFYSSLKPHGYLVLGRCEILPQFIKDKFEIIDMRNRIYRRKT